MGGKRAKPVFGAILFPDNNNTSLAALEEKLRFASLWEIEMSLPLIWCCKNLGVAAYATGRFDTAMHAVCRAMPQHVT